MRQAGRTVAVPEGFTILDAVLDDGIAYPHGCRSGRCGSCKSRLDSGRVDLLEHSRFAFSDEEKAQGLILPCRAIPTTDAIVSWLDGDDETPSHLRRRLSGRVAAIADATHDIKHFLLNIDGADPLDFASGLSDRLLCGDEVRTADVACGSGAPVPRAPNRSLGAGPWSQPAEYPVLKVNRSHAGSPAECLVTAAADVQAVGRE